MLYLNMKHDRIRHWSDYIVIDKIRQDMIKSILSYMRLYYYRIQDKI